MEDSALEEISVTRGLSHIGGGSSCQRTSKMGVEREKGKREKRRGGHTCE